MLGIMATKKKKPSREVYEVEGPDQATETMIPLYNPKAKKDAAGVLAKQFSQASIPRSTLYRWKDKGLAVYKGGPLLKLPCCQGLNGQLATSVEALARFLSRRTQLSNERER